MWGVIVGKAIKHLGTYIRASGGGPFGSFGEDYEPAKLAVGGTITLWEVRLGMLNRPILVSDEDIEPIPPILIDRVPRRASKPKVKHESVGTTVS